MTDLTSFRDVIELWPSPDDMAAEIGASNWAVPKWRWRNNIPAEWWVTVLAAPRVAAAGVTSDIFARWAARETAEAR